MNAPEPIRLVTGQDQFLHCLPAVAGAVGLLAILSLELPTHERLLLVTAVFILTLLVLYWPSRDTTVKLVVGSEQRLKWRYPGGQWHTGAWLGDCWTSRHYAVISGKGHDWRRRFIVCRSRQDENSFRSLLVRLRLDCVQQQSLA